MPGLENVLAAQWPPSPPPDDSSSSSTASNAPPATPAAPPSWWAPLCHACMWPWRACAHRAPSWAGSSKEADSSGHPRARRCSRRRHGDYHRWQRQLSMSSRRAQLERLAKRGLLLVVNGAPIYAAANVHERPQRRPQATVRRCRHRHWIKMLGLLWVTGFEKMATRLHSHL